MSDEYTTAELERIEEIRLAIIPDAVTRHWDNSFIASTEFWAHWENVPEEERELGGERLRREWAESDKN